MLRSQRHQLCMELGYRASDIVQASAVVWVEGPSDRIYINHWLKALRPDFIEGTHYSIMFYGGRLLSHLSAASEEVTEFIDLRSLNQHLALVMDSDRLGPHSLINATKRRLKTEFEKGSGVCWITKGREIENYIEHGLLQAAVRELYLEVYASPLEGGQFDHPLWFSRKLPKIRRKKGGSPMAQNLVETEIDKVAVARLVCARKANLDILDLKSRVQDLASMIDRANQV